jgi:hypothetical protein
MLEEKMETTETEIEHRHMTIEEKAKIVYEAVKLFDEGKDEEAWQVFKSVPLLPKMAKIFKEVYGPNFLIECGYNLLEVEEAYGKDWLYK